MTKREQILAALSAHIESRPGIEPGNYASWRDYRNESASVTRDLHIARRLLAEVARHESIGEAELREAFRAFSGRLQLIERADGAVGVDYCTGQYYPTEYRKSACAVLAQALWDFYRDHCMPQPTERPGEYGPEKVYPRRYGRKNPALVSAGTWLRDSFRHEFGRTIADRYFN